jgi:betaine-aldehyde dehydrogenase/aminobutyraldehyde dehydrogenase
VSRSATRSSSGRCSGPSSPSSASPTTLRAIAFANDVGYGLAASAWTRDVGRALRAARALQFATVWINDHLQLASEMPHGG